MGKTSVVVFYFLNRKIKGNFKFQGVTKRKHSNTKKWEIGGKGSGNKRATWSGTVRITVAQ